MPHCTAYSGNYPAADLLAKDCLGQTAWIANHIIHELRTVCLFSCIGYAWDFPLSSTRLTSFGLKTAWEVDSSSMSRQAATPMTLKPEAAGVELTLEL